jgi:hypothetical protein
VLLLATALVRLRTNQHCRILDAVAGDAGAQSKTDEIQWPALENLTPTNLKRTVSTIMKEWEKSLTPPEERPDPISGPSGLKKD